MSEQRYETRQTTPSDKGGHHVVEKATGRHLGSVGHNQHRAWAFPLHTPKGLNTIQEFAYDHPFHNGVFVGQGRVVKDGKLSNFWSPGADWRSPDNPVFQNLGELRYSEAPRVELTESGARFTYETLWRGAEGEPVLEETRIFAIQDAGDATLCDCYSHKKATFGDLLFEANKHGSIGVRVSPRLLPAMGGEIIAGHEGVERRGKAEVASLQACDYVAYEAEPAPLWRFGVCLSILENSASENRAGPWFIRDYGMAMFNATHFEAVTLRKGETWSTGLRVAAYDGALTPERVRRWT